APMVLNDQLVVSVDPVTNTSVAGGLTFRQNPITGTSGVTKEGTGILTFADTAKAFTGPLIVNTGRLRLNNTNAVPNATSGLTINGVGQVVPDGVGTYTFGASSATPLTLNGVGPANNFPVSFGGTLRSGGAAGTRTITNDIVLQSTSSVHVQAVGNTLNLTGNMSGAGGFIVTPLGTDGNP